ncbi:proton-coupled zinc antiporter SLC30A2-like isoform X2 [Planococcus citri]|uniref:proton-coupled zinc antiporter SLC30A2-like isoform X2 n=1 Tax=Planococcus citri TaxID=170843 RepID=UPI0031FA1D0C
MTLIPSSHFTSDNKPVDNASCLFAPATFYGAGSEMSTTTATSSEGGGGHRVIYCVHGKPEGCCARVLSDTNSLNGSSTVLPSPPITLFEDHCHQSRETKVDSKARRKLIIASILCLVFMIAEVVGGVLSHSLAIATDAAHLLTDFGSFMISLFALWVGSRPATRSMPFGWYRAEVLGALTSVLMIWVVTGVLFYVAVERVISQEFEIESEAMLITSAFGVCVNIVMALTLHQHHHHHHHHDDHNRAKDAESTRAIGDGDSGSGSSRHGHEQNINVRAAYIHVIGDFIQSFGVLFASVVIYFKPEWKIVDPICTFGFSILVLFTTFAILRDTMIVLMEGIPKGIDFCDVLNTFLGIEGVVKVHNLRIWALSLDKMALAAHLAVHPGVNTSTILKVASRKIHQKFNFFEMTLQIEEFQEDMANCKQCQDPLT